MKNLKSLWPSDYPDFWLERGVTARLLRPLAAVYAGLGSLRQRFVAPVAVAIPVVCIGNLSVGGVGKTPTVAALVAVLQAQGIQVHILAHGYGGAIKDPVLVDPEHHSAHDVGDEALLHAQIAPTWVGRNRACAADMAHRAGAELVLLDDGWQNPRLHKDMVIAVVHADDPFGNGFLLPAGPLRQKPEMLRSADTVIAIGDRLHPDLESFRPLHGRRLSTWRTPIARGESVFAFCGLGRSRQFEENVRRLCTDTGVHFCGIRSYPDHYPWDQETLSEIAEASGSGRLVTSAKDWQRLPEDWQKHVGIIDLKIVWSFPEQFSQLCQKICNLSKL